MVAFLIALAVLVGGYFVYGAVAERVFGVEPERATPAETMADGVDFVPLPTWKVFMIQFLNIAGTGPIFGAIMGVMFGPAAFLWIALGTIFAGAVHDFTSAMISLRSGGKSLPEIVGDNLGMTVRQVMRVFTLVLLLLVGAVFVLTPASLLDALTPASDDMLMWAGAIFLYYMAATMLPIDKLIGRLYPIFGGLLLIMALGLMCVMLFGGMDIPDGFAEGLYNRHSEPETHPLFPMLCITIACGAISGFHATQSPLMARCLKNERLARPVFYGAMVVEGVVALVWAAATITFTGGYDGLKEYVAVHGANPGELVKDIAMGWLGAFGGVLAIIGVIAAPISSGDTALRSARLIIADFTGFTQVKLWHRFVVCIPIFAVTFAVMNIDFSVLWRYFAWCNQTLAVFVLWACTVYLSRHNRFYWLTLFPAMFMTVMTVSYLLVAPRPEGFGLDYWLGIGVGLGVAACLGGWFVWHRRTVAHLGVAR